MAYAAYREHPGTVRTATASAPTIAASASTFHVLDVTVACADAVRVRRSIAHCADAGVVRCEPLLHDHGTQESTAPRVRLMVRLPLARYAELLHRLIDCVPSGEIGRLVSWREHLRRCGLGHGR